MKTITLILSLFLLTSCSNPDTSGGVTLSRDVGDGNPGHWPFPDGSCSDQHDYSTTNTGCGWVHVNEESRYIRPYADLSGADLSFADLRGADLSGASGLDSITWYDSDVQLDSSTICPNGIHWGTAGNDCNKD